MIDDLIIVVCSVSLLSTVLGIGGLIGYTFGHFFGRRYEARSLGDKMRQELGC